MTRPSFFRSLLSCFLSALVVVGLGAFLFSLVPWPRLASAFAAGWTFLRTVMPNPHLVFLTLTLTFGCLLFKTVGWRCQAPEDEQMNDRYVVPVVVSMIGWVLILVGWGVYATFSPGMGAP